MQPWSATSSVGGSIKKPTKQREGKKRMGKERKQTQMGASRMKRTSNFPQRQTSLVQGIVCSFTKVRSSLNSDCVPWKQSK